jgi:hypothetical protein
VVGEMGLQRLAMDLGFHRRSFMPGLLAPLSPHEEVTLRRVAIGIAKLADLPAPDVARLKLSGSGRSRPRRGDTAFPMF